MRKINIKNWLGNERDKIWKTKINLKKKKYNDILDEMLRLNRFNRDKFEKMYTKYTHEVHALCKEIYRVKYMQYNIDNSKLQNKKLKHMKKVRIYLSKLLIKLREVVSKSK